MKMKSAVLASALVVVSAAFADIYQDGDIYGSWFTTTPESSTAIDTELNAPIFVSGDTLANASDGYAVTAEVSIVIHSTRPSVPTDITVNSVSVSPKGSICAAYDSNGMAKWYGLKYENSNYSWVELTDITTTPVDAQSYTLVTEFDDTTSSSHRVRYSVISGNTTQTSVWYPSGHANALKKVGLAGTGSYTKVVGLLVNAWSETINDVPISISKATLAAMGVSTENTTPEAIKTILNTVQGNGIKAWANYALGISGNVNDTVADTKKPFAAPVQNSDSSKLTFKLGGVKPPADTGATVTYAVETLTSPTGESSGNLEYKSASDTTDINLADLTTVKYYRVKVKIDQAN